MTIKGDAQRPQIGSSNGNAKLDERDVEIIRYRIKKKRDELANIDYQIEMLRQKRAQIVKSGSINQLALDFEVSAPAIKNVLYRTGMLSIFLPGTLLGGKSKILNDAMEE